ncbi:hypothetical protein IP91_00313 [Pseudoduganella lurida]|uniref:Uncharacterized protein n=1 Tax=Pseudoduganella lurida TaxID=1036180 RepID=A0A562RLC1_9BURK|nr:hypothetical protein [Pseudoduganella lurida]TWI69246.1 hypothetical protein IP91_00313 [Pseudoduganella lurida]
MYKTLAYLPFGWLTLIGVLHFIIDVVAQHLRGKRTAGLPTTLYYGMHTAYAMSEVLVGMVGLLIAWRAATLLDDWRLVVFFGLAAVAWLGFGFYFDEYREPKINVGIFLALLVTMVVFRTQAT